MSVLTKRGIRTGFVIATLAVLAAFAPTPAYAISYTLSVPNDGLSGFGPDYATVTVTLDAVDQAIAHVSITTLGTYRIGDGGTVGVNTNGAATGSNLSTTDCANTGCFATGAGNEDGFGSFTVSVNLFDGAGHSITSLSFDLTKASGTWLSDADVLTNNSDGYLAAAHIYAGCSGTPEPCVTTGYAANGTASVPEPGSLALLGTGVVGLVIALRKRLILPRP